jgi:hypothetical protein
VWHVLFQRYLVAVYNFAGGGYEVAEGPAPRAPLIVVESVRVSS